MGVRRWQIGGNGEPFVHSHALEFIKRIKKTRSYCFANTNGTLIDNARADALIKLKFDDEDQQQQNQNLLRSKNHQK